MKDVSGNTRSVLDKLKEIKADLVRGHKDWQNWDFPQLIKALKTWKEINLVESNAENSEKPSFVVVKKHSRQKKQCRRNMRACTVRRQTTDLLIVTSSRQLKTARSN